MEIPAFRGNLPSNPGKLREQAPSENRDKTMDDLSKQLSSWNVQKPTPFISSSHVPHKKLEKDYSTYTCHYCGAKGHSLHRCNSQTTDEIKKLCRKEGANIVMPDGTRLPFDKNTPYKVAVDKWHAERKQPGIIKLPPGLHAQQMEQNIFQSSFGELEFLGYTEESGSTYDCDVGRESKNKEKVQETPSAKNIRQEQEDSMDEEQGVMDKKLRGETRGCISQRRRLMISTVRSFASVSISDGSGRDED
ncbi:hypothetical protein H4Q26_002947 [Puccinia striiformis f. sp. tritici PST-130]|nr:hypothetical protein H4Q26_002947 [Puccinia striiformis f. sp. tritici PST-130]